MAEAALAVLIVGLMMVAALNLVGMSARARQVNAQLGKGPALAHGLMSEVQQAFYNEPDAVPVLVEGPEVELASYDPPSPNDKDYVVKKKKYIGQCFLPTLPPDAISWAVTRVKFQAKKGGPSNGIASVQLRPVDALGYPTEAILEQYPMPESSLASGYAWQTFDYNINTGLTPGEGLAFVIAVQQDDAEVCKILYDNSGGSNYFSTSNAGATWTGKDKGLPFYVFGKISTESAASNFIGIDDSEGTSNRTDFDDVDDYHGWSASPPEAKDGTALADYTGWTRSVTVEYVNPLQPGGTAVGSDNGAKRITVTVTDPRGSETKLIGVRTNVGAHQQESSATKTYVSWIELDLQIGEDNAAVSIGTALPNEPEAN